MQPEFWHDRWERQQIGFHEPAANPLLLRHCDALGLPPRATVFLPLCGMTLDIDWLLARGHRVIGSELSPIAVRALFERLGQPPRIEQLDPLQRWTAGELTVWLGDHFELTPPHFERVDAVYDRAALIAMPPDLRRAYARQMLQLAGDAPQLLITLEYAQSQFDGPPFSVDEAQLRALYPAHAPRRLVAEAVVGGLKGKVPATENVWILEPGRAAEVTAATPLPHA